MKAKSQRTRTLPRAAATAASADAIHEAAKHGLTDRVGDAKRDDNVRVVGIGPVVFQFEIRREQGKCLAIDVIDDG